MPPGESSVLDDETKSSFMLEDEQLSFVMVGPEVEGKIGGRKTSTVPSSSSSSSPPRRTKETKLPRHLVIDRSAYYYHCQQEPFYRKNNNKKKNNNSSNNNNRWSSSSSSSSGDDNGVNVINCSTTTISSSGATKPPHNNNQSGHEWPDSKSIYNTAVATTTRRSRYNSSKGMPLAAKNNKNQRHSDSAGISTKKKNCSSAGHTMLSYLSSSSTNKRKTGRRDQSTTLHPAAGKTSLQYYPYRQHTTSDLNKIHAAAIGIKENTTRTKSNAHRAKNGNILQTKHRFEQNHATKQEQEQEQKTTCTTNGNNYHGRNDHTKNSTEKDKMEEYDNMSDSDSWCVVRAPDTPPYAKGNENETKDNPNDETERTSTNTGGGSTNGKSSSESIMEDIQGHEEVLLFNRKDVKRSTFRRRRRTKQGDGTAVER